MARQLGLERSELALDAPLFLGQLLSMLLHGGVMRLYRRFMLAMMLLVLSMLLT